MSSVVSRPPGLPRQTFGLVAGDTETIAGIGTGLGDITSGTVRCYVRSEPDGTNPVPAGLECLNPTAQGLVDVNFTALQAVAPTDTWSWYTLQFEHLESGNRTSSATSRFAGITVAMQPSYGNQ